MKYLYFIPGFYTYVTRVRPEGLRGATFHSYGYVITVSPILITTFLQYSFFHILALCFILVLCVVLLYSIYEVLYIVNDFISIRYENLPTTRASDIKINPLLFALTRSLYSFALIYLLSQLYACLYDGICALICLLMIGIIHNIIRNKFARHPTHVALRVLRFSFPTVWAVGLISIPASLIALLPNAIYDEIGYFRHNLRKLLKKADLNSGELPRTPFYELYLAYLPFQVLVLMAMNMPTFLLGNIVLIVASLLRKLITKPASSGKLR